MKFTSLLALTSTTSVLALVSVSDHAVAATPPVIAFASLPAGTLKPPPSAKKTPVAIEAHERVAGVFVGALPQQQASVVGGTREQVDRFSGQARQRFDNSDEEKARALCFSSFRGGAFRSSDEGAPTWEENTQSFVIVSVGAGSSRVDAVHLERIVEEGDGRATLEVTDAWVDGKTRGARLIGRSKLPLKMVASAPGDIRLYAMRDADRLHVFLVEPSATTRSWQGIVQANEQGMTSSGCRHSRASLALSKGSAETTTFVVTAELPATEAVKQLTAADAMTGPAHLEPVRIRPMRVHASVSWASRDKDPVLSVSMGWEARDKPSTVVRSEKPTVTEKAARAEKPAGAEKRPVAQK